MLKESNSPDTKASLFMRAGSPYLIINRSMNTTPNKKYKDVLLPQPSCNLSELLIYPNYNLSEILCYF